LWIRFSCLEKQVHYNLDFQEALFVRRRIQSWAFERQHAACRCFELARSLLVCPYIFLVVDWVLLNSGAPLADVPVGRIPLLNVQNKRLLLIAPAHLPDPHDARLVHHLSLLILACVYELARTLHPGTTAARSFELLLLRPWDVDHGIRPAIGVSGTVRR
jgi:hypothetical protein